MESALPTRLFYYFVVTVGVDINEAIRTQMRMTVVGHELGVVSRDASKASAAVAVWR